MHVEPTSATNTAPAAPDAATMRAARGFEQLLVRQLAQTLVSSVTADGDGSSGTDESGGDSGTQSLYTDMLPDALSPAIDNAGGLGLAQSLAPELSIGAHTGGSIDPVLPRPAEESSA